MNIFVLDLDPKKAAIQQIDKHVVKMPLETAQMLCTALGRHGLEGTPYKQAYKKHPCTIWAGDNRNNFQWLVKHGIALSEEYTPCKFPSPSNKQYMFILVVTKLSH